MPARRRQRHQDLLRDRLTLRKVPAGLHGLEIVQDQRRDVTAVLDAEQRRRKTGSVISRPAWENLVFTGGRGPATLNTIIDTNIPERLQRGKTGSDGAGPGQYL